MGGVHRSRSADRAVASNGDRGGGGCLSTAKSTCAGMSCCACRPGTWNGTCAGVWLPCCSRMRLLRCCDSPVQKAQRSQQANAKAATRTTPDGDPVYSLTTLLQDLATVTLNQVTLPGHPNRAFTLVTKATPLQTKLFRMLKIDPKSGVAINRAG